MTRDASRDWIVYGAEDPYFGVLTEPRFHRDRLDDGARAEFWATGEAHVERLAATFRTHFGRELAPGRGLDFGCGVGRVLLPLARRSRHVVGVDVAPGMLAEARGAAAAAGLAVPERIEFASTLTGLVGPFDLVHSFIVLQHIPAADGMRRISELLALLAPGGLAVLHVPYAKPGESAARAALRWARAHVSGVNGVVNLLARRPWQAPNMQMNVYDLNAVLLLLQHAGCHRVVTAFSDHSGVLGVVLFAEKRSETPY